MDATVVFVAYGTTALDSGWIPADAAAIVVHNDETLDPGSISHHNVTHIRPGDNIGFGAAVNLAARHASTERLVLCNPDTRLSGEHWDALNGRPDEIVTIPLVDNDGNATSVVAPFWTPLSLLGTVFRVGLRLAPLGSRRRSLLAAVGPVWVRDQQEALASARGWPLEQRWVSGAVMSVDRRRFLSVDGFDDRYFLYFEDTDLCSRLAERYPGMQARIADCPPGIHTVGGSSNSVGPKTVPRIRRRAALTYGATRRGWQWFPFRLADALIPSSGP